MSIAVEIEALEQLTTNELATRYAELHGRVSRSRHRTYLIRKIAWRLQANAEGDLSERARRRAEVRVMAPKTMIVPVQEGRGGTIERHVSIERPRDPRLRRPARPSSGSTRDGRCAYWSSKTTASSLMASGTRPRPTTSITSRRSRWWGRCGGEVGVREVVSLMMH